MQIWSASIENSRKGTLYKLFKQHDLSIECYLLSDIPVYYKKCLTKYRTTNHRLPIEVGRWNNVIRNDRKCELCNLDEIGDEYHYLLVCSHFSDTRSRYIDRTYYTYPNMYKFVNLITTTDNNVLLKLCKFIAHILKFWANV